MISQLVRAAVDNASIRILAQGELSAASLDRIQALLQDEEKEPLLLNGLRGQRAMLDGFMNAVQVGDVKFSQVHPDKRLSPDTDVGIRLWDVSARRQSAWLLKLPGPPGMAAVRKAANSK